MSDKSNHSFQEQFSKEQKMPESQNEWDVLVEGLKQRATVLPITPENVEYLLRQWAYLEITDSTADAADSTSQKHSVQFIPLESGWIVHDLGNILRASPGHLMFGPYWATSDDEEGGNGGRILAKGKGTIVQQYVETAWAMVEIAQQRWSVARIAGGYRPMQLAAFMYADSHDYLLDGFSPSRQERKLYAHIQKIHKDKLSKRIRFTREPM